MANVRSEPKTTGETVTVACKLPNGLILRVFEMITSQEPVPSGGFRDVKVSQVMGEPVTIYGNATQVGVVPPCRIVAGYALTPGVSKDFWELWLAQNEQSDLVKNGIVFANPDDRSSEAQAKDGSKILSGLEPLATDRQGKMIDTRIPKRVGTADEQPRV